MSEQVPNPSKGQITEDGYNIEVDGHIGIWYVIDTVVVDSTKYFLLEHEEHGDSAPCVIVDGGGKLVLDDIWNGFDDLKEHFESRTTEKQQLVNLSKRLSIGGLIIYRKLKNNAWDEYLNKYIIL